MGTRSITDVIALSVDSKGKETKTTLLTMYGQWDGYPHNLGLDIADFLNAGKLVDGFNSKDEVVFNGAGCLAAQLVANFKKGVGSFYIIKANASKHGEQFRYQIIINEDNQTIKLRCLEVGYRNKKNMYVDRNKVLFFDDPKNYSEWLETYED
jgi:hypothetical protein